LGIAKYILPFVFIYNPAMVFEGNWIQIVTAVAGGFAGIYALTVTTEGWMLEKVGWIMRIIMGAVAVMLFHPDLITDLVGWVLFVGLIIFHWRQTKNRAQKEALA
jgi:TRAP-type uncharacterized transport system fused permease subunit